MKNSHWESPFFLGGCLGRVSTAGGTISFLRDDVENRKVGRETGGRKDRTRSHRKERRLPLLPFSSSLTIYPFGTTAHPPTFLPRNSSYSRLYPPHHRPVSYSPSLLSFHFAFFPFRLVFNGFSNYVKKNKRERKIKIYMSLRWGFDHLMIFFSSRVAINIS